MKKTGLFTIVGLLMLAFSVSMVFAAPTSSDTANNNSLYGRQHMNLTDTQKEEVKPLFKQMVEIKKQVMQKFVSFGIMTQDQADQRISRMQNAIDNNAIPNMGIGHNGKTPRQGKGNQFKNQQQNATYNRPQNVLTDSQKNELKPLVNQMLETKKQLFQKYVSFGVMTQEQADQHITRMENCIKDGTFNPQMGLGRGGKGPGQGRGPGFQNCPQNQ